MSTVVVGGNDVVVDCDVVALVLASVVVGFVVVPSVVVSAVVVPVLVVVCDELVAVADVVPDVLDVLSSVVDICGTGVGIGVGGGGVGHAEPIGRVLVNTPFSIAVQFEPCLTQRPSFVTPPGLAHH